MHGLLDNGTSYPAYQFAAVAPAGMDVVARSVDVVGDRRQLLDIKVDQFKRILGDGEFVVLHCLQRWPGDHDYAGIDIFRLTDDGKILEHWDVLQDEASRAESVSGLPMFGDNFID